MKIAIVSLISLLVGLGIGCYVGYREWDNHITNEALNQLIESQESSEALAASVSLRAIGSIETDDAQKAIQLLSIPIGNYYFWNVGKNNALRAELLAKIEQLIKTNETVAKEINKRRVYYETPDQTN
jgi:hypothetical protein